MNEQQMKMVMEGYKAFNDQVVKRHGHHYTEICDFQMYPEVKPNGAIMCLKFRTKRFCAGAKEELSTIEFNSFEQIEKWFKYHT